LEAAKFHESWKRNYAMVMYEHPCTAFSHFMAYAPGVHAPPLSPTPSTSIILSMGMFLNLKALFVEASYCMIDSEFSSGLEI
jgi:hypothetical protein